MNILLSRIRALAFFALLWGAWFNAAVSGPVEALSTPGKTVLYREPSLWERHPRLIVATAAILVLQSLLIVGLIVQRSRWKRAEQSLRDSEERMNLAAEAANLGMAPHMARVFPDDRPLLARRHGGR